MKMPKTVDFEKIKNLGEACHSYSQGGFLTSTTWRYVGDVKITKMLNRIKKLESALVLALAAKAVYGIKDMSPYNLIMKHCTKLGMTEEDKAVIENYSKKYNTRFEVKW